ncbi:MAG: PAS domain-containing sensor histidine kinase [Deltaproteobacteria bacterium]|nr:PAS domain-containing sensor histidine kinase [Deltaproteobacteria bacterium]
MGLWFVNFALTVIEKPKGVTYYMLVVTYGIAIIISLVTDLTVKGVVKTYWGAFVDPGVLFVPIVMALVSLPVSFACFVLVKKARTINDIRQKMPLLLIVFGTFLTLSIGMVTDMIMPFVLGRVDVIRLSSSTTVIVSICAYLSVIRYNFLSMGLDQVAEDLFKYAQEGIILISGDRYITQMNDAAKKLFNLTQVSPKAWFISDILDDYCDDLDYQNHEIRVNPKGETRYLLLSQFIVRESNLVLGKLIMLRDITERKLAEESLKKSEERHRLLVETMNDGLVVLDETGVITYVNERFSEMLGYSRTEMTGRPMIIFLDQTNRIIYEERMAGGDRRGYGSFEITWTLKNDLRISTIISPMPIHDDEGRFKGSFAVITDITERKLAEDALRRAHDELELRVAARTAELAQANQHLQELDRMKSEFLSSVSHELRTPLTSILGFTKLIRKDFLNLFFPMAKGEAKIERKANAISENLEIIVREGERLTRLINDVLDLAKIESGRVVWRDSTFPVADFVYQAAQAVSGQFLTRPDLTLSVVVGEDLPYLKADRDRLEQVLINLLNNAAKFTNKGQVAVEAAAIPDGWIKVPVRDTGVGIHPGDLEKIFDQFHQVARTDTLLDKPQGTGLGLAICRHIIDHYKGRIWAESVPDQGSVFTFVLPGSSARQPATPNLTR